jgi:hypothetical protein
LNLQRHLFCCCSAGLWVANASLMLSFSWPWTCRCVMLYIFHAFVFHIKVLFPATAQS